MESQFRTTETDMQDCSAKDCKLPRRHEGRCDFLSPVMVTYTNWKGSTRRRRVCPTGQVEHKATEWHKVPCWLFEAIDCDDGKLKKFAISGIAAESRTTLQVAITMRWNNHG